MCFISPISGYRMCFISPNGMLLIRCASQVTRSELRSKPSSLKQYKLALVTYLHLICYRIFGTAYWIIMPLVALLRACNKVNNHISLFVKL